jgi:hypothetical protein
VFKESKVKLHPDTKAQTDTGYQGIQHIHANTELPKKASCAKGAPFGMKKNSINGLYYEGKIPIAKTMPLLKL